MPKTKTLLTVMITGLGLLFVQCNESAPPNDPVPAPVTPVATPPPRIDPEPWMFDRDNAPTIALTNNCTFHNVGGIYGSGAFLLEWKGKVYGVTSRSLIQDGDWQLINSAAFNGALDFWHLTGMPRSQYEDQPCTVRSLINTDAVEKQEKFLLFEMDSVPDGYTALKPATVMPEIKNVVSLIGCPDEDSDCQQEFIGGFWQEYYEEDKVWIFMTLDGRPGENYIPYLGAPVLDSYGHVLGIFCGLYEEELTTYGQGTSTSSQYDVYGMVPIGDLAPYLP